MKTIRYAAAAMAFLGVCGCNNFLSADKAVSNPNQPTVASVNQLLVAIEANIFGQQEGPAAMLICEWMQQCAGTAGRFVEVQGTGEHGTFSRGELGTLLDLAERSCAELFAAQRRTLGW